MKKMMNPMIKRKYQCWLEGKSETVPANDEALSNRMLINSQTCKTLFDFLILKREKTQDIKMYEIEKIEKILFYSGWHLCSRKSFGFLELDLRLRLGGNT